MTTGAMPETWPELSAQHTTTVAGKYLPLRCTSVQGLASATHAKQLVARWRHARSTPAACQKSSCRGGLAAAGQVPALTSKSPVGGISAVTLRRTNTTLGQAEKCREGVTPPHDAANSILRLRPTPQFSRNPQRDHRSLSLHSKVLPGNHERNCTKPYFLQRNHSPKADSASQPVP